MINYIIEIQKYKSLISKYVKLTILSQVAKLNSILSSYRVILILLLFSNKMSELYLVATYDFRLRMLTLTLHHVLGTSKR